MELAEHLRGLGNESLALLLTKRPDACVEPAPGDFGQLAQRLQNRRSVADALWSLDADAVLVGQTLTALGPRADRTELARATRSDVRLVDEALDRLLASALIWPNTAGGYDVAELLAEHWVHELGLGRPAPTLLQKARVDELRVTAAGLGIAEAGLRQTELVAAIGAALADPELVERVADALPSQVKDLLDDLVADGRPVLRSFGSPWLGPQAREIDALVGSGLVVCYPGGREIPREVGLALRLRQPLTGPPDLATSATTTDEVAAAARAAAQAFLGAVTTLLDESRETPIAKLRGGGVGARERKRLAGRLDRTDDEVVLYIDLAHAAGLLAEDERGYRPTGEYDRWRGSDPGPRMAELLRAWHELPHAPFARTKDKEKPHPPPLPLDSDAGVLRRRMLRVCADAPHPVSADSVRKASGWWCPFAAYPDEPTGQSVLAEAEHLGVIAADTLSSVGIALAEGDEQRLWEAATDLLPPAGCTLTLQSDLTAVVIGEPPADLQSLLNMLAVTESRGNARTWRFSPDSVRAGFDSGLTADELLDRLTGYASQGVPQPLEYLIKDVSRRYGSVTVSAAMCCVRGEEAHIAEIMATKALRKLRLVQLAPTVVASPKPLTEVTDVLRGAGFAPAAEDVAGNPIVQAREDGRAVAAPRAPAETARSRLAPEELVARLRQGGTRAGPARLGTTARILEQMAGLLTADEIRLLADAVDTGRAVAIGYVDNNGKRTHRTISDLVLADRWIEAWCHLREDDRMFTVSHIDSVAPA